MQAAIAPSFETAEEFIVFGQPEIGEPEIAEVIATLRSGWLGTGPRVARFESNFAGYRELAAEKVAAVNSGTAALHLALLAAGVGPGDEVIVPAMTFCASVNAIIHAGATPVLADVALDTMNLDPADVARRIGPRTRALLPVHFAGRTCDMGAMCDLAEAHGLRMVEDCAHAVESTWQGKPAGTFGDFGCFSFYVTKNMTTGEGGMVVAKAEADIDRIKVLALHGMNKDAWHRFGDDGYKHYAVTEAGFKYNMTDLQAAIGMHQLARIDEMHARRDRLWKEYTDALAGLPVTLPLPSARGDRHAYHLYTVRIPSGATHLTRDAALERMTQCGIGVGVHYLSIAEHPFYRERFGFDIDDTPNARDIGRTTLSLPFSATLTRRQIERVITAVRSLFV